MHVQFTPRLPPYDVAGRVVGSHSSWSPDEMSEEAAPAEHPALQALDLQRLSCFVQVVHRRVCSLERERAQDLCACADF